MVAVTGENSQRVAKRDIQLELEEVFVVITVFDVVLQVEAVLTVGAIIVVDPAASWLHPNICPISCPTKHVNSAAAQLFGMFT